MQNAWWMSTALKSGAEWLVKFVFLVVGCAFLIVGTIIAYTAMIGAPSLQNVFAELRARTVREQRAQMGSQLPRICESLLVGALIVLASLAISDQQRELRQQPAGRNGLEALVHRRFRTVYRD